MVSERQTTYACMPGVRTGLGTVVARDGTRKNADNPHGLCKRCGGRGSAHYLTCPLLRLPDEPEPLT
jgi:hypothetical protein